MARGWESKSIEEQQSAFTAAIDADRPRLSPQQQEQARQAESLGLSRSRVLEQMKNARNERYRELLHRQLEHLDAELAKIGRAA